MSDVLGFLDGKKTYITALLVGLVTALHYSGVITDEQSSTIYGFLGAFGLYAVKSAISKV